VRARAAPPRAYADANYIYNTTEHLIRTLTNQVLHKSALCYIVSRIVSLLE